MPFLVPPTISKIPQGHRVTAQLSINSGDGESKRMLMGGSLVDPVFTYDISMSQVQKAAQIGPIKAVQFSCIGYPQSSTAIPLVGILYLVVDALQVFAFQFPKNPDATIGFMPFCFNATVPVNANAQSTITFGLFVGNYPVSTPIQPDLGRLADIYINLMDYDVPPSSFNTQGIFTLA
jgi:hypothetical protein